MNIVTKVITFFKKDYATGREVCHKCGKTTYCMHGERNWYGKEVWLCSPCNDEKFCEEMNSSPIALAKYHEIYGDSPENIIMKKTHEE